MSSEDVYELKAPFDGEVIARVSRANPQHLDQAIEAAEAIQHDYAKWPVYKRTELLKHVSRRLREDQERLATILAKESGKPLFYARGELARAAMTFEIAAEEARRIHGEIMSLDWTEKGKGKDGYVKQFPVGLVAGISPFNFPLNLAAHKIAPALATGCPIVLKPASQTPLSTLELAKILDETDLPKGAVSILPMTRETGDQLVTDDRFKLLSFTGSPSVGWSMKARAGKKPVVLELGGNAAAIVATDHEFEHTMSRCLIGGFAYCGQVCIHLQRIYVKRDFFDRFVQEFVKGAQALKRGNPTDSDTQMSVMIDEKNAQRVETWVQEALDAGAQLLTGGKRDGLYMEPTVLTNVPKGQKVLEEEVFGPVVVIEPYDAFDEAIAAVNDSSFGLQAGVFTQNFAEVQQAFHDLEVGGVLVNEMPTFRVDHIPYGGVKESGLGREGLRYAMEDMLEKRILIVPRD